MEEFQQNAEPTTEPRLTVWNGACLLFTNPSKGLDIILYKWQVKHQLIVLGIIGFSRACTLVDPSNNNLGNTILLIIGIGLIGVGLGWIGIWLMAQITHALNKSFGGNSDSSYILTAFAFASIPLAIYYWLSILGAAFYFQGLEILFGFLYLCVFIYGFILMFIGNQKISGLPFLKNLGAVGIPVVLLFVLGLLIFMFQDLMR